MNQEKINTARTKTRNAAGVDNQSTAFPKSGLAVLAPPPPLQLKAVETKKKEANEIDEDISDGKLSAGSASPLSPPPPSDEGTPVDTGNNNTPIQQKEARPGTPQPFQLKPTNNNSNGLPEEIRGKMENAFQSDFSDVKIQQNSQSATDVGALAYAQGNYVHFAPGQFKPNTQSGQELIGHELAHVVQQRAGRVQPTASVNGMAVNNNEGLEREADNMGKKAASQMKSAPAGQPTKSADGTRANIIQKQEDPEAKEQESADRPTAPFSNERSDTREMPSGSQSPVRSPNATHTNPPSVSAEPPSLSAGNQQRSTDNSPVIDPGRIQNQAQDVQGGSFDNIMQSINSEYGNMTRAVLEITRLVPGVGIVTGAVAQTINLAQDHVSAKAIKNTDANGNKQEDKFLVRLTHLRNGTNIANGLLDDCLYLNQMIGNMGGHATGITQTIAAVGGFVNNFVDGVQIGFDLATLSYSSACAAFPDTFGIDKENTEAYEEMAQGYAANTVADSISGILGIVDTATGGMSNAEAAKKFGLAFQYFTKSQKLFTLLGAALKSPYTWIGLGSGIGIGVFGGSAIDAVDDRFENNNAPLQRREAARANNGFAAEVAAQHLDRAVDLTETVWDFGSGGIDFMAEAIPKVFEQGRETLTEICGGTDPVIWIRNRMTEGINDAARKAQQLIDSAQTAETAEQYFENLKTDLTNIETRINGLTLPTNLLAEDTEIGDNLAADFLEGVVNTGAGIVNSGANFAIDKIQNQLDKLKASAVEKITYIRENLDKVLAVLKIAVNKMREMYNACLEIVEMFALRLSEANSLEDFLNVALGTVADIFGIEGGLSVEDLRQKWIAIKQYMDESFETARGFINSRVRGQDTVQQKAVPGFAAQFSLHKGDPASLTGTQRFLAPPPLSFG